MSGDERASLLHGGQAGVAAATTTVLGLWEFYPTFPPAFVGELAL